MTPEDFYKALKELGFDLSQKQKDQFQRYFELLVEWNEKINLTAITERDEVYLKHFYDSLAPVLQGHIKNQTIRLLDIGAGAGFPSLPMKILCPELDVTIIDSLNKRINFLNLLADELELSGVHFYHGRAEDFGQDKAFRAQFDIVTARAVARMQVLSELTIPFLKVGGQLIALKATAADQELANAKNALNLLFAKSVLSTRTINCQMGMDVISPLSIRKKKPQISTHVVLGCLTKSRYNVYPRMFLASWILISPYDNSEVFIDKSSFSHAKACTQLCLCHYSGEYFT